MKSEIFFFVPGASGMGNYHGRWGFETFSHKRGCMLRSWLLERVNVLRYPPYTESNLSWLRWATTAKKGWAGCSVMWALSDIHIEDGHFLDFVNEADCNHGTKNIWLGIHQGFTECLVRNTNLICGFSIVMSFKTPPEVSIEKSCFFWMLLLREKRPCTRKRMSLFYHCSNTLLFMC